MLEWLQSIGDFLVAISKFIIGFFTNVIELVSLVFKAFTFASTAIAYLPIQYQLVISASVAFVVIVTIVHFGG